MAGGCARHITRKTFYSLALMADWGGLEASSLTRTSPVFWPSPKKMTWTVKSSLDNISVLYLATKIKCVVSPIAPRERGDQGQQGTDLLLILTTQSIADEMSSNVLVLYDESLLFIG